LAGRQSDPISIRSAAFRKGEIVMKVKEALRGIRRYIEAFEAALDF
jgi:hypothetical protein